MENQFNDIFSNEDLDSLNNNPDVISARESFANSTSKVMNFSITLPSSVTEAIYQKFNITILTAPMRLIKEDTPAHFDVGANPFDYTYLIYLDDNPGELVLGNTVYSIVKNTGFKFSEGITHETRNTLGVPRLLIGPMDQFGSPVGRPESIVYYASLSDATDDINVIETSYSSEIGAVESDDIAMYTHWKIYAIYKYTPDITEYDTSGTIYSNGDILPDNYGEEGFFTYYIYPVVVGGICFPSETPIKTDQGIIDIDKIDITKHTIRNVPIVCITKTFGTDDFLVCFTPFLI